MANLAKVTLAGNLTRDPEIRYTTGGVAIGNMSVAVNRRVKKNEEWASEVSFFDVVCFGKTAEACEKYLSKGKPILVDGELVQRSWESKDGQKRSKIEITARDVQFLESKRQTEDKPAQQTNNDGPPPIDDDDIPF